MIAFPSGLPWNKLTTSRPVTSELVTTERPPHPELGARGGPGGRHLRAGGASDEILSWKHRPVSRSATVYCSETNGHSHREVPQFTHGCVYLEDVTSQTHKYSACLPPQQLPHRASSSLAMAACSVMGVPEVWAAPIWLHTFRPHTQPQP